MDRVKLIFATLFLLLLVGIGTFTSCRRDYTFVPAAINTPVSFKEKIIPVFTTNCSAVPNSCHAGSAPAKGLNLTADNAYNFLFATGQIDTVANKVDPEANRLYQKIKPGGSMAGFISAEERNLILAWLKQGAKND